MSERKISVLGSTGSIGVQTLQVMRRLGMRAGALTAHRNVELLEAQAREFEPELVVMGDARAAEDLKTKLRDLKIKVVSGAGGLEEAASLESAGTVVAAISGIAGLLPALAAVKSGKRVAIANKEPLVCAGRMITALAAETGAELIPVDSEHSAVFQCLRGGPDRRQVKRIILTASGGPFFGKSREELQAVSVADALRHPKWKMGQKISVDSATLMNKGLEVIEAMRLFGVENVDVVIHRESIVHSMVEFCDGSVLAQMGVTDMRLPIQYALTFPDRLPSALPSLDFNQVGSLTFCKPDYETFACLGAAFRAARRDGIAPAALNGADEAAVDLFLHGRIAFLQIPELILEALERAGNIVCPTVEDILEADRNAREFVYSRAR